MYLCLSFSVLGIFVLWYFLLYLFVIYFFCNAPATTEIYTYCHTLSLLVALPILMDKNMKILVVDDFSTMRRIVRNLLGDLGYTNITEADDGTTAWPLLQASSFDFVVTDWNMPGMTGIELLSTIRGAASIAKTPVRLVHADAQREKSTDEAGPAR